MSFFDDVWDGWQTMARPWEIFKNEETQNDIKNGEDSARMGSPLHGVSALFSAGRWGSLNTNEKNDEGGFSSEDSMIPEVNFFDNLQGLSSGDRGVSEQFSGYRSNANDAWDENWPVLAAYTMGAAAGAGGGGGAAGGAEAGAASGGAGASSAELTAAGLAEGGATGAGAAAGAAEVGAGLEGVTVTAGAGGGLTAGEAVAGGAAAAGSGAAATEAGSSTSSSEGEGEGEDSSNSWKKLTKAAANWANQSAEEQDKTAAEMARTGSPPSGGSVPDYNTAAQYKELLRRKASTNSSSGDLGLV